VNLYWYAGNNPIKYTDPKGLEAKDCNNNCDQSLNECMTHALKYDAICTSVVGMGALACSGGCSAACLFLGLGPGCVAGCLEGRGGLGESAATVCQGILVGETSACINEYRKCQ